jgi:hypothetical protein
MALGRHFRVDDLVERWGISRRAVIRLVDEHTGKVPVMGKKRSRFGPIRREYRTRLIPESLAEKIYKDLLR